MARLLFISLLLTSLSFVSCKGKTTQAAVAEAVSYKIQVEQVKPDSLLVGIQSKINNAFMQSFNSGSNKPLLTLSNELKEVNKTKKQNLILYWRSYLQFYSAIYYLKKDKDKETAEKEIGKGIDWLDKMEKKNSEDYALLAMLQGFSMQFKGMKAVFISKKVKENLKHALAIDSTNLRAYYVYANGDLNTPEKYGGGKEGEKYLLKAISLPAQKTKNNYLPSWGKEESYGSLISLYIKKEKWDSAIKYFQEGIMKYPTSYLINQLASKLVGK